jgi:hypothetical protein
MSSNKEGAIERQSLAREDRGTPCSFAHDAEIAACDAQTSPDRRLHGDELRHVEMQGAPDTVALIFADRDLGPNDRRIAQ